MDWAHGVCLNHHHNLGCLETVSGSFVKVGVSRCLVLPSDGSWGRQRFGWEASTGYILYVVNLPSWSMCSRFAFSFEKRSGLIGSCTWHLKFKTTMFLTYMNANPFFSYVLPFLSLALVQNTTQHMKYYQQPIHHHLRHQTNHAIHYKKSKILSIRSSWE